jgi:predicted transposase/invertase (TIGR01784 family)
MILGVSPLVDYAFKHLYGRDKTRPLLIHVTDSVLDPPAGHHINYMDVLNPFNPKEALTDKLSILDIKARDQSGRHFNIEMQMVGNTHYSKRVLYYACKLHQHQLQEGQDYLELKPTISITFLNDMLFPGQPAYHHCFRLLEQNRHFPLTQDLEFHILELPKFTKTEAQLTTDLDIWLYFLIHAEKMDLEALPPAMQRPLILFAIEELKMLTQADLERERYESRRKAQLDYNTGLKAAQLEGELRGLSKGEKIGLIIGFERVLHRPKTAREALAAMSLDELTRLVEELEKQVGN